MSTYNRLWRLSCGAFTVLGLGIALLAWSMPGVLVTFMLAAVLTGLWRHVLGRRATIGERPAWGTGCARAAAGGMTAVSIGGLAEVSGSLTVLLVTVAVATSPRAVKRWRSRLRPLRAAARHGPAPGPDDAHDLEAARSVDQSCLSSLSDAELCLAWRRSYTALLQPSSVMHRALIVACRQAYLDEMERRDPVGLSAWLCSGARAASGPDRFLHGAG